MDERDKTKDIAEQLCYVCLHQRMLIGSNPLNKADIDLFPVEPYCNKRHSNNNIDCADFEPDKEKVRRMVRDIIDILALEKF